MENQYKGPERRESIRVKTEFPVLYNIGPRSRVLLIINRTLFDAIAENISEGGMAILTNVNLPVDASVHVNLTLYNIKEADFSKRIRRIKVGCKTRYSSPTSDGAYTVGLQFLDLSEQDRHFIANYIKDLTPVIKPAK